MRIDKSMIVFLFWAVAATLFLIIGIDIDSLQEENLDYVALGLASFAVGFIVREFLT